MLEMNFTLLHKRANKWMQFAVSLFTGWVGMLICKLTHANPGREYFAALVGIIFYTLINTVISLAHKSYFRYTVPSYYLYVFLVAVLFLSAKFLSGISIWNLEEYRMMLLSVSVFYIVISIAVRAIKYIYEAAESGF